MAAAARLLILPGLLRTPQHLSLNSITYCSSSPFTSCLSTNSLQAHGWGAWQCWGGRSKLLETSDPNFAPGQQNVGVIVPIGPDGWTLRAVPGRETPWGCRPLRWPVAPGPVSPCPARQPPAARRREVRSKAVTLGKAGEPLNLSVLGSDLKGGPGPQGRCGVWLAQLRKLMTTGILSLARSGAMGGGGREDHLRETRRQAHHVLGCRSQRG